MCQSCDALCENCLRFLRGDRIELSTSGIMVLGGQFVGRGTVLGAKKKRGMLVIEVNWDGLPGWMKAQVKPQYIRKLYGEEQAFI